MKIRAYAIDWGRYRYEFPEEDVVEVAGNWFDWFATDEAVEKLRSEVGKQLRVKYGVSPRTYGVGVVDDDQSI